MARPKELHVSAQPEQLDQLDDTLVTGYAPEDRYLASRYTQGSRTVYDLELPLEAIPQVLPVPDPDRPTPGNRKVKPAHARDFGAYVRKHEHWVAPSLLMRAPEMFNFETLKILGRVSWGILGVPRSKRRDVRIIDGQHRILGLFYALEDMARELDEAREGLARAQREKNVDIAAQEISRVKKLERERDRFAKEFLGVQIHVETEQRSFEQMFFDVADNALGITQAVKVRFDSRKILHRTLDSAMKHALLRERVDIEQDRIGGTNPNLLGARHVVDIVRSVNLGILGRVSRRQEGELEEGALVQRSHEFFDILLEAFPDLAAVADGTVTPEQLRKSSLLGSSTMLRILAGVYYELWKNGYDDEEVVDFFKKVAPHTGAPLPENSPWVTKLRSGVFAAGSSAPTSRRQDLRSLTEEIVSWIDAPPTWL
jgi:hypothetical protein